MSAELIWRLNTACWGLIAAGCLVWGANAVILAVIRWGQEGTPVLGSWNPWRWTWPTAHGLKDLFLAITALSVVIAKAQNGPGAADTITSLVVRGLTAGILWLCIARWTRLQWEGVRGRSIEGRTP